MKRSSMMPDAFCVYRRQREALDEMMIAADKQSSSGLRLWPRRRTPLTMRADEKPADFDAFHANGRIADVRAIWLYCAAGTSAS